ncbi:hypothetical protein HPE56_03345 [Maribacter sp. ANRC-HE7]|uniref:Chagasin family peptidase inhibitor I42 n=1 Tax=Maribacter aquimaris TaxID=2737171 RepID=A0ABR7UWD3_9FLAO|nr:hypothetical protein [Maribacter aquimaris]MBD0776819.1 hypothetical protein [Maribacter aquimaris]
MFKRSAILFISICLVAIGCAGPYSEQDNGSIIELSEDDVFTINLKEQALPQYAWHINSINNHVELKGPIIMGPNGTTTEFTFNFKTLGTGEDKLTLFYTNGKDTRKSFELTVIVGTMGRIESY